VSRLVLVRHAEPAPDARGRCYGRLDVELSDRGREQAEALAVTLRGEPTGIVVSSPRLRALQTAAALGRPVEVDDRLCELDFGDFEGRTFDEIAASEPELYRAWMETPTRVRFPGGESYADLKARALRSLDRIWSGGDAVVVTHGGVIRAGLSEWLGIPDEAIFRIDVRYGGVTVVERVAGTPIVRMVNG
jgi:broad specificity phosphatase PhoE